MRFFLVVYMLASTVASASENDWPAFRGPHGTGITQPGNFPTSWSPTDNIRWSVALPQPGNGSAVVVGDRVFVTSAEDSEGHIRTLFCHDVVSGKERWRQSVTVNQTMPTHKTNPYAGTTPACHGDHVVVWHSTGGLHAYSLRGESLWSHDLGEYRHMWGYGTSPIIYDDHVILHTGPGRRVFVIAFDLETGKELWRHEEPVAGTGERNQDGRYMGSWATPVITTSEDRVLALCSMATRLCAFDIQTGELVWFCSGLSGTGGDLAYSSPMIENDLCVTIGGFRGPGIGLRIQGTGDLTKKRLWRNESNPQNIGTGLFINGHVYRVGAGPSVIDCMDATTGTILWKERAAGGTYWGSLVYDGRYALATDQEGRTIVFQPSPEGFVQIGLNALEDTCNSTPALAGDTIFIRTHQKLWCIRHE
ncbi:MAG: PQQ-binding-like beta-propeller repeat protein [Pirellulales bacterium]